MAVGKKANLDEIRSAAQRVAGSLGLDVVDLEFSGTAKQRTLCIYLEKNQAGRAALTAQAAEQQRQIAAHPDAAEETDPALVIPERFASGELNPEQLSWLTHEDCAAFSRDFGTLLDVEDLIPDGEYTLEASSPGLDRKLSTPADLERFQGNIIKVQTLDPIANNRHWQGRYTLSGGTSSSADSITLDLTATRQNSKSRKAGVASVTIAFSNIEKAQIVPEF
jgi:ribosome maturation factor RimP